MHSKWILSLALTLCLPTASVAELYRWTDDNGKVHYSDRKPSDIQAQPVEKTLKPVNIDNSRQQTQKLNAVFPEHEDSTLQREAAQKRQQREELQRRKCAAASDYLQKIKGPVYFVDEQGKEFDIPESERKERQKELEQYIETYCQQQ